MFEKHFIIQLHRGDTIESFQFLKSDKSFDQPN